LKSLLIWLSDGPISMIGGSPELKETE